jgi:hypothetical protein
LIANQGLPPMQMLKMHLQTEEKSNEERMIIFRSNTILRNNTEKKEKTGMDILPRCTITAFQKTQ